MAVLLPELDAFRSTGMHAPSAFAGAVFESSNAFRLLGVGDTIGMDGDLSVEDGPLQPQH